MKARQINVDRWTDRHSRQKQLSPPGVHKISIGSVEDVLPWLHTERQHTDKRVETHIAS